MPGCLNQYGDEEFIVCIAAFAFDGLLCEGYGTSDFGLFAGLNNICRRIRTLSAGAISLPASQQL